MNWISLKERVPELEQRVLCCTAGDDEPQILIYSKVKSYDKGRNVSQTMDAPTFCRDLDGEDFSWPEREFYPEITHWMPLPKPPLHLAFNH
jgi:hypothetical protein